MTAFGEKLRREREMRGVSLDEICESTKIGMRSLRALEENDFDKLPGGIFNKGFVRAYARFLGLDEEQTVADFEAAWKQYRASKGYSEDDVQLPIIEENKEESPKTGFSWLLAVAIFMIVVLLATWYFVEHERPQEAVTSQPHPVDSAGNSQVSPQSTSTTPPVESGSSQSNTSPASGATTNPPSQPAPNAGQTETQSAPGPAPSSQSSSLVAPKSEQASKVPPLSAAPIRLNVFAREDSWLSVLADGKNLGEGVLTAQKSRTIHAQKEVKLKLGNVGGVEVSFNGKPVNVDGEPKQVKELTFTPDGLRQ